MNAFLKYGRTPGVARESKLESLNIYKRAEEERIREGTGTGIGGGAGTGMGVIAVGAGAYINTS